MPELYMIFARKIFFPNLGGKLEFSYMAGAFENVLKKQHISD